MKPPSGKILSFINIADKVQCSSWPRKISCYQMSFYFLYLNRSPELHILYSTFRACDTFSVIAVIKADNVKENCFSVFFPFQIIYKDWIKFYPYGTWKHIQVHGVSQGISCSSVWSIIHPVCHLSQVEGEFLPAFYRKSCYNAHFDYINMATCRILVSFISYPCFIHCTSPYQMNQKKIV